MKTIIPLISFSILLLIPVGIQSSYADPVYGDLFYTRFSGTSRVEQVTYSFDGTTFSLGAPSSISGGHGADGITGNPNDPNSLLVADQGRPGNILRIDKSHVGPSSGVIQTAPTGVGSFHLEVSDPSTLYVSDIPGTPARVILNGDGSIGASTPLNHIGGPDAVVTQVITTPSNGFFYTRSGPSGSGNFGTLTFSGAADFQTTQIHTGLAATHGGTYDPYSGHIIIFGDTHMTQINPATGAIVSDRDFTNSQCTDSNGQTVSITPQFDQGTVDGIGHAYVADNSGYLFFVDYSASGMIGDGSNFVACQFLATFLDDIAPLVGSGGTQNGPVGGELLPLNFTALILAGVHSFSWMIPLAISMAGIGLFVISRKTE